MFFTTCGGRSEISVIQFGRHNNTFPSLAAYIQCTKQNLVCLHVQLRLLSPFLFFCSSFICSEHEQAELINCTSQLAVQFAFTLILFHPEMSPSALTNCPFSRAKSVIIGECIECILVAGELDVSLSQQIISLGEFSLLCFHALVT